MSHGTRHLLGLLIGLLLFLSGQVGAGGAGAHLTPLACPTQQVTVLPPRRPDLNAFVERYHRSYEERPHQGLSCGNQPPCPFDQFVEQLCAEARTGRRGVSPLPRQLALGLAGSGAPAG